MTSVSTRVLRGFDDPAFGPERWEELLRAGDTDVVFLTWHWQRSWWETLGRGELLLIAGERNGQVVALAPFYADSGMIFFVGSGKATYMDFLGDIGEAELLDVILETARSLVPDFVGFRFYGVLDSSRTGKRLKEAADRLGLEYFEEALWPAPEVGLAQRETALAATRKKSLVRHEHFFRREGSLEVHHLRHGEAIVPHLEEFFEQHISRWEVTPYPSLFHEQAEREFYERLTRVAANTGWLRFTRLDWNRRPIAFHFGYSYRGRYHWHKPSFVIDLARRSPGEVLLRQLLLATIEERASVLDFGMGDEAFKLRFATHVKYMRTWGLYPN